MTLEALQAIGQVQASSAPAGDGAGILGGGSVAGPSFSELVRSGMSQVNDQLLTSQADMQRLAVGDVQNLHQVMIRLEETRLSFELMLQVRNRVLEAYHELMKMQV